MIFANIPKHAKIRFKANKKVANTAHPTSREAKERMESASTSTTRKSTRQEFAALSDGVLVLKVVGREAGYCLKMVLGRGDQCLFTF